MAEWNRLHDQKVEKAQNMADEALCQIDTAASKAEIAQKTADTAKVAGETALNAVSKIAEQKTGILGKSVNKATKKSINSQVEAYWASHGDIKAGAPEK